MITEVDNIEWQLAVSDRCDSCGAQAYVQIKGIAGELLFCSHHYTNIMDSPTGYKNMMGYALEIIDERDRLIENRLQG
jgi:hypothetical protein